MDRSERGAYEATAEGGDIREDDERGGKRRASSAR